MITAVFQHSQLSIARRSLPSCSHEEALVKVRTAGISTADTGVLMGCKPFSGVPGHMFVGEVVQTRHKKSYPADNVLGKRVVADIMVPCNACSFCCNTFFDDEVNKRNHCSNCHVLGSQQMNGSLAEYVVIPFSNLYTVPNNLSDNVALFAVPVASALRIFDQKLLKPSDDVAILGDGKLGWTIALVLSQYFALYRRLSGDYDGMRDNGSGCQLTIFGKHQENAEKLIPILEYITGPGRVTFALAEQIDTHSISSGISLPTQQSLFNLCIDASGSCKGVEQALQLVRPLGTVVIKTTTCEHIGSSFSGLPCIITDGVNKEVTIVGSLHGTITEALEFLSTGNCSSFDLPIPSTGQAITPLNIETIHIFFKRMISGKLPLYQIKAAFAAATTKGALQIVVTCDENKSLN